MKKCTVCHISKPLDDFHHKGPGVFAARCKECACRIMAIKYKHQACARRRIKDLNSFGEDLSTFGVIDEDRLEQWRQETVKNKPKLLEKWD